MILLLLLSCASPVPEDTAPTCPAPVAPPTPADLNGDGYGDLAFAQTEDALGNYVATSPVFWGGPEGFSDAARTDYPTVGADDVAVADLDQDGWPELIFASVGDGENRAVDSLVYRGGPDGPQPQDPLALPTVGAAAVTVADLDQDGFLDLLFSNRYDGGSPLSDESYQVPSRIYWGGSTGPSPDRYSEWVTWGAGDAAIGDLDQDGSLDVAVASGTYHTDTSWVYLGGAEPYDLARSMSFPTLAPEGVLVADLTGDGFLDLFFANFYDIPALDVDSPLYRGGPDGPSVGDPLLVPTHGATDARAVDLDADGCLDLVVAQSMEGSFFDMDFVVDSVVRWGGPGGPGDRVDVLPTTSAAAVDAADLDGDGDVDLIFAHRYDGDGVTTTTSRIYWNESGFDPARYTALSTVGAAGVAAHLEP